MPDEPVDPTAFAELLENVGGDQAFLGELVETYVDDCPLLFTELRAALAAGDAPVARRAAHSLKSTSASMGALRLSALCRELEVAAGAGDLAGLESRVDAATAEYALVEADLRRRAGGAG
ncbi:MAG: Hpt domain-containing protein [Candidatus Limnocylindrales bacterium]